MQLAASFLVQEFVSIRLLHSPGPKTAKWIHLEKSCNSHLPVMYFPVFSLCRDQGTASHKMTGTPTFFSKETSLLHYHPDHPHKIKNTILKLKTNPSDALSLLNSPASRPRPSPHCERESRPQASCRQQPDTHHQRGHLVGCAAPLTQPQPEVLHRQAQKELG